MATVEGIHKSVKNFIENIW